MYIISKKKDYYDGVAGTMGIDKTIVYNRETIKIDDSKQFPEFINLKDKSWVELRENPVRNLGYYEINKEYKKKYIEYNYFIVGFCGKLYIGWKLYSESKKNQKEFLGSTISQIETTIMYDEEQIKSMLKNRRFGFKLTSDLLDDIKYIKNLNVLDIFRQYDTPVFIYDNDYKRTSIGRHSHRNEEILIINPNLNDYEFYKVFDSFQAFQEISMFIGGVLGNKEKEIVQISDKNKIEQYGFDYKLSFRKEKQDKR